MPLRHCYADVSGIQLHYVEEGSGKLILFVHGFPEFWYEWHAQLADLGRDHHAVALDLRGYNLSSKPQEVDAYRTKHLVEDIRALAATLTSEPFALVAHDWGGAVAWAFAIQYPELLSNLIILNSPHPAVFARELTTNPKQQRASQYMRLFQSPEAEDIVSFANFRMLKEAALQGRSKDDVAKYVDAARRDHRRPQLLPRDARETSRFGWCRRPAAAHRSVNDARQRAHACNLGYAR